MRHVRFLTLGQFEEKDHMQRSKTTKSGDQTIMQPSSETVPQTGIRALAAFIATSFTLDPATKDKITQQIVGFGRALMFGVFGDGDPVLVYEAYAKKVEEFAIPKTESMIDAIRDHCLQAREVWLANRFATWTKKFGKLGSMSHDDATALIQGIGTEIIALKHEDLIVVMTENQRHGLAALVRGITLVHQFDGSAQLAAKVDAHLGVLTIVEPTSAVLHPKLGNGDGVEIGDRIEPKQSVAAAAA